jgi:hypothetical protein
MLTWLCPALIWMFGVLVREPKPPAAGCVAQPAVSS